MHHFQLSVCAGLIGALSVSTVYAATRYVNVSNAAPAAPHTNWATASTNLQQAIDWADSGDEILVAPGIYRLSGSAVWIPTTKALTLRSVRSREAVIDAQGLSLALQVQGGGSVVEGFTVRNGSNDNYGGGIYLMTNATLRDCLVTRNQGDGAGGIMIYGEALVVGCTIASNQSSGPGGGVVLYSNSRGRLDRCVIRDNVASSYGGGVWIDQGGAVSNSVISENASFEDGGGVYMTCAGSANQAELVNSVIWGNSAAQNGGGVYAIGPIGTLSPVVNCTIVSNTAGVDGGGAYAWTTRFVNDILYYNSAPTNANLSAHDSEHSCIVSNCCVTPDRGLPCITNAPAFVDAAGGDFHLATASFCIDAGTTNGAPGGDIEGRSRLTPGMPGHAGLTDIGAYEYAFHFNDIRFTAPNTAQLLWDVQDRGIYRLDAATNGMVSPPWIEDIEVYTNPGMAAGQFMVRTQTVVIPSPVPAKASFRLRVGHTLF